MLERQILDLRGKWSKAKNKKVRNCGLSLCTVEKTKLYGYDCYN